MAGRREPLIPKIWERAQSAAAIESHDQPSHHAVEQARRERRRALIVPREHGAWGLLLVPMVTGAGVAIRGNFSLFPFLLLLTASLTLFWLRTPFESLLGTSAMRAQTAEERNYVLFVVGYLAAIAALTLSMLLWGGRNRLLWAIGAAVGVAFVSQAVLKKLGRHTRMLSEIAGTIGLTSSAPAAYYVMTGDFGITAWMLWLANLLFAGNQIHYVQIRIHTARVQGTREKLAKGWAFAAGQLVMVMILGVTCYLGWLPWIILIAYVPIMFRGWIYFVQKPQPLHVRRLGWNELAQAVVFCVLFIATI